MCATSPEAVVEASESEARYEEVRDAYLRAASSSGEERRFFLLAGHTIELRGAGALIGVLARAVGHLSLPSPAAESDLTILLWDSATTGADAPSMVGSGSALNPRGFAAMDESGPVLGVYQPPYAGLSMLHTSRSEAIYWHPDANNVHVSERAGPLRTILGWWLGARGYALIHGAAVGTEDGAALIASRSGAGKSTTALACVLAGLLYAGDDFCYIDSAALPTVHSLSGAGKVFSHNLARLPALEGLVVNPEDLPQDKALVLVNEAFPDKVRASLPLRAVLIPTAKGLAEPVLAPMRPAQALRSLAPSSILLLAGARPQTLAVLGRLVANVPAFSIGLAGELSLNPPAIAHLLAELAESERRT